MSRHRAAALRLLPCEPEVHHHHSPGSGQHDVLGLDIAVDEAGLVDRLQPGQELRGDVLGFLESSGPRSWRTASRVAPSTYSIDTSSRPSTSTRSKIRQTLGDITSRAARTSWRKSSRRRSLI